MENCTKVYLVVTEPLDLIGVDAARQLSALPDTAHVVMAFPKREECHVNKTLAKLRRALDGDSRQDSFFRVVWFDSSNPSTKSALSADARKLAESIYKSFKRLDGIMLNSHGTGNLQKGEDPGVPRKGSGLIPMAEKKLFGNVISLDRLLESRLIDNGSRVVFAGTEAARGLPKMGFPVPNELQPSQVVMEQYLNGSIYDSPFRYESAYGYIGAILALYVAACGKKHPKIFFSTVSPGMTQESLKVIHLPHPTLFDWITMFIFRVILFPVILKRYKIAHDYSVGASYFVQALTGTGEWGQKSEYESGVFVAAFKGTSGPIGDQYHVPNGTIFRDEALQETAYETVRKFLD